MMFTACGFVAWQAGGLLDRGDGGQAPVPSLKIKNLQNIPSIAA